MENRSLMYGFGLLHMMDHHDRHRMPATHTIRPFGGTTLPPPNTFNRSQLDEVFLSIGHHLNPATIIIDRIKMSTTTTATAESTKAGKPLSQPLYPDYLPHYDPLEAVVPVGDFEYVDPGSRANPAKPNLLRTATASNDLSPHVGTELLGVQLDQLSPEGLDELALMCAERGCLVFRDQNFTNIGFEAQKRIAEHFGPLHKHGWMPHPKNGPEEFVIVYDSKDDLRIRKSWSRKNPVQFHVDQSPEKQPPGATFFCMLESPPGVGGDTIISSVRIFCYLLPPYCTDITCEDRSCL